MSFRAPSSLQRASRAAGRGLVPPRPALPAEDVLELAQRLYTEAGPLLGVHVRCRLCAVLALGVAAGMGIPARLHFAQDHAEAGGPHFWIVLPDGSAIDNVAGPLRLLR